MLAESRSPMIAVSRHAYRYHNHRVEIHLRRYQNHSRRLSIVNILDFSAVELAVVLDR
jgi:hypothetical protein